MSTFSRSKHGIRSWSDLASAVEPTCPSANAVSESVPLQMVTNEKLPIWSADFLQIIRCLIDGAA